MDLLTISLLPFAGALALALFGGMAGGGSRKAHGAIAGLFAAAALALVLAKAPAVIAGEVASERHSWIPALGLDASFFLDPLGLLFAGLILGIGVLVIAYASFYLSDKEDAGRFFAFLMLFQGAMLGIVLSYNIVFMLVFWEMTSLSSFLLIGFWRHKPEGRQGARMALAVTGGGGLALIGGMVLLGNIAGTYDLTAILGQREAVQSSPLYPVALVLILLGCFTKSAQFPFHFWLPRAMAAPTPVSAYLHSATMVKAGVFLMARLWPVLAGTELWFYLVATTGLVTMVAAAAIALFKDDLKALLAYSTVSHLGLLTMLLGFGTKMAAVVAVFHIVNHATFKAALFMNAGIVDHETGTRDIRRLGGLIGLMPIAGVSGVIAGLSMAGFPPFNGFISKEMMLEEAAHTAWAGMPWLMPAAVTLGALFSAAYSFRYVYAVYFGPKREDYPKSPHDPGIGLWGPPAVLVALVVLIGLFPTTFAGALVESVSRAVVQDEELPYYYLSLWHGFTPALFMSVVAVIGGAALLWRHGGAERAWRSLPVPDAKRLFDRAIAGLVAASRLVTDAIHTGSLPRTLFVFVLAALLLGIEGMGVGGYTPGTRETIPASPVALIAWAILIAGALAVVLSETRRFLSLIYISIIGLIVSLAFVYLSAPDLALTQISVEVVTILLLLLALNLLPKAPRSISSVPRRVRDGALASVAGAGVAWLAYAVMTRTQSDPISAYHWAMSKPGGGGTNVVNVILVDFRGFDTFGEIIVLGIAAIGIYALLKTAVRGESGRRLLAWIPDQIRSPERHPMMLVVAGRLILPLALAVALYIFLRGHNLPGGGFIAGLVFSIALLIQYMASGFEWAEERRRTERHALISAGVLIAAATGLGSLAFGKPFLTSAFDYYHLPLIGEIELATALLFDIGVALTVVGAVMLALAQLSGAAQRAEKLEPSEHPMDIDPSRSEGGSA
ncbi:monovalent cation/H+ antiporter subunit A [Erythrobacter sp.]|uniref:monovalent cation/H+ antiporter subunit A n=1 Tax=Erythrobacter sp. TaxID=1042 RepID=UPI001425DD3B|nr:monovalent cation/H+ antiporter subunit A [Erythrobacter sp.]QIQ86911.1 MAG: monovalent cation/H+ antiporter subunit A [Erythrobacter sp.]